MLAISELVEQELASGSLTIFRNPPPMPDRIQRCIDAAVTNPIALRETLEAMYSFGAMTQFYRDLDAERDRRRNRQPRRAADYAQEQRDIAEQRADDAAYRETQKAGW